MFRGVSFARGEYAKNDKSRTESFVRSLFSPGLVSFFFGGRHVIFDKESYANILYEQFLFGKHSVSFAVKNRLLHFLLHPTQIFRIVLAAHAEMKPTWLRFVIAAEAKVQSIVNDSKENCMASADE